MAMECCKKKEVAESIYNLVESKGDPAETIDLGCSNRWISDQCL